MKIHLRLIHTCLVLCLSALCANAAVYTVVNTNNDGAGSLRAAVNEANSTSGVHTINFNIPETDPNCAGDICTIGITSPIASGGRMSIVNPNGADTIIIRTIGAGFYEPRAFDIQPGADITIDGLTTTGSGNYVNWIGGGINNGGTLMLKNSVVRNHRVYVYGSGGGIYNYGTMTLINSTVTGNSVEISSIGAGITNLGTMTINRSNINGNGRGGAIYNKGTMTVTESNINDNGLGDFKAFSNEGNLTITGSNILRNNGGAIDNFYTENHTNTVTMINTIVAGNDDGVLGTITDFGGSMYIINSTITANQGKGGYVGIFAVFVEHPTYIRNTIVSGNYFDSSSCEVCANGEGAIVSNGNNLIGITNSPGIINWQSSDILGQPPRLAPLGNYGGAT